VDTVDHQGHDTQGRPWVRCFDGGMSAAQEFSLRRIAVPAFAPSAIWAIGNGATLPIIALSGRELGASVSLAAILVGLTAAAEFVFAVPAGIFVARVGEQRGLLVAAGVDALGAGLCWWAPNLMVLALGLVLIGPSSAIFLISRQSYLTAVAPVYMRARAMSMLGGVTRVGWLVGPLIGAAVVARFGTQAAYAVAVAAGLLAMLVTHLSRGLEVDEVVGAGSRSGLPEQVRVLEVVKVHRRVLATVGTGVLAIAMARSGRAVAIPLWGEQIGLSPARISLIFGAGVLVEVLIFYPSGLLMDRRGRVIVAVPTTILLGLSLILLPLTTTALGLTAVSLLTGLGNGLGSGIVMTLGADAAPQVGRAQFLSVWRLLSLVGHNGSPLAIAAITALSGLAPALIAVGVASILGGGWLAIWLPGHDPRRRADGIPPRGEGESTTR